MGREAEMLNGLILTKAIREGRIVWRRHALERMLQREIKQADVKAVLLQNEPIEMYPDDRPFPSALFAGRAGSRLLHVVGAVDEEGREVHIISAYEPDRQHFEEDGRTRRRRS
jgi:hypothetical protein